MRAAGSARASRDPAHEVCITGAHRSREDSSLDAFIRKNLRNYTWTFHMGTDGHGAWPGVAETALRYYSVGDSRGGERSRATVKLWEACFKVQGERRLGSHRTCSDRSDRCRRAVWAGRRNEL